MATVEGNQVRKTAPLLEIIAKANWGRWGPDDELGAINYLGSNEMRVGLAAAHRDGEAHIDRYALQTPMTGEAIDALVSEADFPTLDTGDPHFPSLQPARRDNDVDHLDDQSTLPSGSSFSEDQFVTPLSLHGTTHFDALAHGWYGGKLYNGFSPETTHTARSYDSELKGCDGKPVSEIYGIGKADISHAAGSGVAGRGVLLDVGRHRGEESPYRLNMGEAITLDDLLATADAQGVDLRKRDILLIRTGSIECARDSNEEWQALDNPGLTYSDDLVRWVRDMEIPIIGADNLGIEQFVHHVDEAALDSDRAHLQGDYLIPLHSAFLRDLGVTLNETLDLSSLSEQAARDGIYEFLYTAAPLHIEMGTAAPVNPVVIKATGR